MYSPFQLPPHDCPKCPRLCRFREDNRKRYPSFFNGPVPSFGELNAQLLVVGLAPGLKGANQTGRPFTGDYAGIILYEALLKNGFAKGKYEARIGDVELIDCRITNAVRCVPQENKPETSEIKNCNDFLKSEIATMPKLKLILSLGLISHNAVLKALGLKAGAAKFTHGAIHTLSRHSRESGNLDLGNKKIILIDSYHCSRYNINTGRLTPPMFDAVMKKARSLI